MNVYEVRCFDVNTDDELIDPAHLIADSLSNAFDDILPTLQYLYIDHDFNPDAIKTLDLNESHLEISDGYYRFTIKQLHGVRAMILRFMQGRLHRNIRRCIK